MYFPIFLDITGKKVLVIGSGKVAQRKLSTLLKYTTDITVLTADTEYTNDQVSVICETYNASYLDGFSLVIAATDSAETNSQIASDCREHGILCDVSIHPQEGDFVFPGVVKRGDLTVAITTDGKAPAVAGYVRETLEEVLPDFLDKVTERAEEYRQIVFDKTEDSAARRELNRQIVRVLVSTNGQATDEEIQEIIDQF